MGAGQYPAGGFPGGPFTRAGVDPVWVGAPPTPLPTFRAIKFDPATRSFVFNANGTAYDVHPIDQQVVLLLWVQQGTLGSVSTFGTRIRARVARAPITSIPQIVRDEVEKVLDPLITAGDVQYFKTDVDVSTPGRVAYAVFYKNLRDLTDNETRRVPGTL